MISVDALTLCADLESFALNSSVNNPLYSYYRCPEGHASLAVETPHPTRRGYFKFGSEVLYGTTGNGWAAASPSGKLEDLLAEIRTQGPTVLLPFDPTEVLHCLRYECYTNASDDLHPERDLLGRIYYLVRPLLVLGIRKQIQKLRLHGWREIKFPSWPVDRTVDNTLETLLLLSLRAQGRKQIPFIWFWPDGASSCAIMTHDVETTVGRDFCSRLMDINDSFRIKSSFQVVPENRYDVPTAFLDEIRRRGFEVNVHDLNHDGLLFRSHDEFRARAATINQYGRDFGASGFRSAILYRRQEWYDALDFSYDMSVPNVAHLDPQRGGCCTVMPYFVKNMVELPVTMTQDYSLFYILNDHSLDLWKQQTELIRGKHGLMNFIVHPDYVITNAERKTYVELLGYLTILREQDKVWMPLPREAAAWWRERSAMKLVEIDGTWRIEGKGKERARVAYASESNGRLAYSLGSCN
jgi:hypothetical protein